MRRKLIAQGLGGYTLTLPVKWVREHNLKSGSEIDLDETETDLLIRSSYQKQEKSILIDISNYKERMIHNILYQAYRRGFDIIKFKYQEPTQLKHILKLLPNMLGFEMVESKNNICVLQNIAEPEAEKFEILLRRLMLQVKEISEKVSTALLENRDLDESISTLQEDKVNIDKNTNYLRRTIIRTKPKGEVSFLLYGIITQLSLLTHDWIYLYETVKRKTFSPAIKNLLQRSNQLIQDFYDSFYSKDLNKMHDVGEAKQEKDEQIIQLLKKANFPDNVVLTYLKEIMRLLQSSTTYCIGYHLDTKMAS
jgi:phosphate uptake regulator